MAVVGPGAFSASFGGDAARALAKVTGRWWVVGLLGFAVAVLGLLLLVDLAAAVETLVALVAIAVIVDGVGEIATAERYSARWPSYVMGVLWMGIGVGALVWPGITLLALAVWVGVGLVVAGLIQSAAAVAWRESLPMWGLWLALGILTTVVGVVALVWPGVTILTLAIWLGVMLLVRGIGVVWFALGLRSLHTRPA